MFAICDLHCCLESQVAQYDRANGALLKLKQPQKVSACTGSATTGEGLAMSAEESTGAVVEASKEGASIYDNWQLYWEHFQGNPRLLKTSGVLESGSAGAKGSVFPNPSRRQAPVTVKVYF